MSIEPSKAALENAELALTLDEIARRLAEQDASLFRVQAYHRAAAIVRDLDQAVLHLLDEHGRERLEALPGIGHSLAHTIEQLDRTDNR